MKYKICKVHSENKFHEWDHRPHCRIAVSLPLLSRLFNAVFWRPAEIRPPIEDLFENPTSVVDRDTNAKRQDEREKPDFALPVFRAQFSLSAKIENCRRNCCGYEDRKIDQEHADNPTRCDRIGAAGRWMEQHAKKGQQQVSKI